MEEQHVPAPQPRGSPSRSFCREQTPCSHASGGPGETHRSTKWGVGSSKQAPSHLVTHYLPSTQTRAWHVADSPRILAQ